MNARLLKHLLYATVCSLFITTLFIAPVPAAQAEALFLFRSPDVAVSDTREVSRPGPQENILKLDEKGDLLIQCGNARFTIAYSAPADQFKPSGTLYNPQRDYITPIIGISLTASLSF